MIEFDWATLPTKLEFDNSNGQPTGFDISVLGISPSFNNKPNTHFK